MDSDVALIWLAEPLEYGPSISPIDMFNDGEEIKDGELTVVTGWGNTRVSVKLCLYYIGN